MLSVSKCFPVCETSRDSELALAGVGNGMAVAVLPTWNGECARGSNRGRAVLWQLNINIVSSPVELVR